MSLTPMTMVASHYEKTLKKENYLVHLLVEKLPTFELGLTIRIRITVLYVCECVCVCVCVCVHAC